MKRILVATLLALSASVYAFGQCSEGDKQKLMAFDKAWGEASRARRQRLPAKRLRRRLHEQSPAGTLEQGAGHRERGQGRRAAQALTRRGGQQPPPTTTSSPARRTRRPSPTATSPRRRWTAKSRLSTRAAPTSWRSGAASGRWSATRAAGRSTTRGSCSTWRWSGATPTSGATWLGSSGTSPRDYYGVSSRTGKLNTKAEEMADIKSRKERVQFRRGHGHARAGGRATRAW